MKSIRKNCSSRVGKQFHKKFSNYKWISNKRTRISKINKRVKKRTIKKKYKVTITIQEEDVPCRSKTTQQQQSQQQNQQPTTQTFLDKLTKIEPNSQLDLWKTMIQNHPFNYDQLRDLRDTIDNRIKFDIVSCLPYEIALYIMSFLSAKDLTQAALTCKSWQTVCEDSRLWREKCEEEGLFNDENTFEWLFKKKLIKKHDYHLKIARIPLDYVPRSEWKAAYIRHVHVLKNWTTRKFEISEPFISNNASHVDEQFPIQEQIPLEVDLRNESMDSASNESNKDSMNEAQPRVSTSDESDKSDLLEEDFDDSRTLRGKNLMQLLCHEDSVITCLQYNPRTNIIVSGSDDQTLKVWSSDTGKCINTLEGHTGGVWSSQLSPDDIVISGSTDRTLRVWDAHSGKLIHTLWGHSSTVRCLALENDQVVSGSRDTTLRLWDIKTGECLHVYTGHTAAVRCVEFKNNIIVSGAYDNIVMVWDAKEVTARYTLANHVDRIYSLQFDGRTIASGSLDSTICIWDAEEGKLIHSLQGHTSLTSKMQLKGNLLVSANADTYCRVWDVITGECLHTLGANGNKHTSAITSVHFDHRHVVTSGDDGTVKLWDLKTGQFLRDLIVLPTATKGGVVWRIRASYTKLICAVGSRTQTEDTHLLVANFED